jgi:hypothetical protein
VQTHGTFASFKQYTEYVNPGLHITGLGQVGLPVAAREAEAISKICKQAPFGKGAQTIVDTSVRRTWELDPSEFECQNPAWKGFVDTILRRVENDMGISFRTQAQLYKLLLYEEGAFFKSHRDSEKVPGMYGTLVLCLPSEHTGGDVRLVQGKTERVLRTASGSKFDMSALAWYSDVKHEVKPIESGYRLVLTYNLVQDQGRPLLNAMDLDSRHKELSALLRLWVSEYSYIKKLTFPLDQKYTNASLSRSNLKGADAAKVCLLDQVREDEEIYWFLANCTKSQEDDNRDNAASFYFDHIVTPNGNSILKGLPLEEEEVLKDYSCEDPDSEDEEEYMGNYGAPTTSRYHDTVLVLMRKEAFWDYCKGTSPMLSLGEFQGYAEIIRKEISSKSDDATIKTIFEWLLKRLPPSERLLGGQVPALLASVSESCYRNKREHLVRQALKKALKIPQLSSSTHVLKMLVKQLEHEVANGDGPRWDLWMPQPSVSQDGKLAESLDMAKSFSSLRSNLPPSLRDSFSAWMGSYVEGAVRKTATYNTSEVPVLVELIPSISPDCYFS